MIVRTARTSDEARLFPLVNAFASSFVPDAHSFSLAFAQIIQQNDAHLLIAEGDSELLGYCLSFDHFTFFANGRVAWVEEIMVIDSARRTGVGKALMHETEKWALERGSKIVALATRRASAFYSAIGYSESATYFRKLLP